MQIHLFTGAREMLIIIFAESALETVPKSLWSHPSVKNDAHRRGKHPRNLILDRSYHYAAMKTLEEKEKRGRPDIVHFALLQSLGSPLNREGLLQVYVHTYGDCVININSKTRLPRNYNRFVGLMEQLFEQNRVPSEGPTLLELKPQTLPQLVQEIKPSYVAAFSTLGSPQNVQNLFLKLQNEEKLLLIIGGFPHGHFSKTTTEQANEIVRLDPEPLETWIVTSMVICAYSEAISLTEKRLRLLGAQ
jgi:rRNA small subunit pseudouridine methyltransferase Nep1